MAEAIAKPDIHIIHTLKWLDHPLYHGCIGHWLFNERGGGIVFDYSRNKNQGVLQNFTTPWTSEGVLFDASDDAILVGRPQSLNNIVKKTVMIRAQIFGVGENQGKLVDKRSGSGGWGIYIDSGGGDVFYVHVFSTTSGFWRGAMTAAGDHFILFAFDSTSSANNPIGFIDGEFSSLNENLAPAGSSSDDSGVDLYFGNDSSGNRTADARFKEVRIWDRILSNDEIYTLYDQRYIEYRKRPVFIFSDVSDIPPPSNIQAETGVGLGEIDLSWDSVEGANSYNIHRSETELSGYVFLINVTETSYTDSEFLAEGTEYFYKLASVDGEGQGVLSDPVSATTIDIPDIPQNVAVEQGTYFGELDVSWDAAAGATSYNVYRSLSSDADYEVVANTASTSFADSGLDANTEYFYRITATDGTYESANSETVSETTVDFGETQPPAPTGLMVTPGSTDNTLNWDAGSEDIQNYHIYRSTTEGSGHSEVAQVGLSTTYLDEGLSTGTTYYYYITADNIIFESDPSAEVSGTPTASYPNAPINLAVSQGDGFYGELLVEWDTLPGAEEYAVYRSLTVDGTYSLVVVVDGLSYLDTGLEAETEYFYKVAGLVALVPGTLSGAESETTVAAGENPPRAPINVSATPGNERVILFWSAGAADITSWHIYRSTTEGSGHSEIDEVVTPTYTDTDVENDTTYYYYITADNGNVSESDPSAEVSATPVETSGGGLMSIRRRRR